MHLTLAAGLVFAGTLLVLGVLACTPAQLAQVQSTAAAIAPGLQAGCQLAGDTGPAAPYLDLLCVGAEAADAALAHLPAGTGAIVSSTPPALPDAAPELAAAMTVYRLRVLLHAPPPPHLNAGSVAPVGDAGGGG